MTNFIKYLDMKLKEGFLYYISDETGKRELHRYNLADGSTEQVTHEMQNVKNYWFVNDRLMISTDYNGNEREQFKLADNDFELTAAPDHYHYYGTYMDGHILYFRNHQEKSEFELCMTDLEGRSRILNVFRKPTKIISKFRDGQLLLSQDATNIDSKFYIYDIENAGMEPLPFPEGRFKNYNSLDEDEAVFVSDFKNGYLNLYSLNKENWDYKRLSDFKWNIEHFILAGRTAYLTLNENGFSTLYEYDIDTDALKPLEFPGDGVIHSLKKEKDHLYILYSSKAEPHRAYNYHIGTGRSEKLFGNSPADTEIMTETGTYVSFDALDVPYYLYRQTGENVKTVIHIHGGPESQARPEFNELYYKLYGAGYQIAVPNIRGSTGYHKFYIGLDDQLKRLDALDDIIYLREHLITSRNADPEQVFIMGRSYGGFMTLMAVTQYPELWKGAVDIVGISHLRTLLQNTSKWRRQLRSHEYGFIGTHDDFFEATAPLENAGNIQAPLRIFHSKHDVRVPYSESDQMYGRMKRKGKDVDFVAYENEGHQYMHTENIDDMNNEIIRFFNELSRNQ
ncbi:dipeptidyl aminopeptidase/acylaminoacyl peptidase [Salinicoccus kekensis]|uniref:Dipeptidyl aminopeptidase/acylaminoacyl peptidase n=2 Tax=Salinicoccus kekensis TaxID=714307 RepID=A0A285UDN0_9STAP|nr:dipeptidyl aminopeptidase/acylaminoacyl peptidase [Salinicoccus kekensis]